MSDKLKTIDMYAVERLYNAIVYVPGNSPKDYALAELPDILRRRLETAPPHVNLEEWLDWPEEK